MRMRVLNYGVLVLFCLINLAVLLFGLGMDGMRHSRPSPDTFDPYYLECYAPAIFASALLATAFVRFGRGATTAFFGVSLLLVGGLFAYLVRDLGPSLKSVVFSAIVAVLFAVPAFSWRTLQRSRMPSVTDEKTA